MSRCFFFIFVLVLIRIDLRDSGAFGGVFVVVFCFRFSFVMEEGTCILIDWFGFEI